MNRDDLFLLCFLAIYVGSIGAAWVMPGRVKRLWVMRQNRLLERMRGHYVLGEQAVMLDDRQRAQEALSEIAALERMWARGDSWWMRGLVALVAIAAGFAAYMIVRIAGFAGLSILRGNPGNWVGDDGRILIGMAVVAVGHGLAGFFNGAAWRSLHEPHGLGEKLAQLMAAERAVARPHRNSQGRGLAVARELFGLGEDFTRGEFDKARRRLARMHHPDMWSAAEPAVQRAHEAAMKRINAAYEQLSARRA